MQNGKRRRKPGRLLMAGGLLLLAASCLLAGYNLLDEMRAGQAAHRVLEQMASPDYKPGSDAVSDEQEIPDYVLDPSRDMPTVEIDGNAYVGTLDIPPLDLSLPVMSDWSYPKLKTAPCRYAGTAYQGGFVIAGHNYRGHFGTLSRLTPGEQVTFTDVDGNRFNYQVAETQVLRPTEIEEMTSEQWDLSLFTCTLDGQTRFTVRCDKVETGTR